MPADLRAAALRADAPLVMLLDATTARIHWEMVAQPDPRPGGRRATGDGATRTSADVPRHQPRLHAAAAHHLRAAAGAAAAAAPRPARAGRRRPGRGRPPARGRGGRHRGGRPLRGLQRASYEDDARTASRSCGCSARARRPGPNVLSAPDAPLLRRPPLRRPLLLRRATTRAASGWIFSGGERLSANELNADRPHPQVRLLQRLRVGDHARPLRAPLGGAGARASPRRSSSAAWPTSSAPPGPSTTPRRGRSP